MISHLKNDSMIKTCWFHYNKIIPSRSTWQVSKDDELFIKNEEFCIQNEEFCIQNEECCIKNEEVCIKNEEFCI